MKTEHKKYTLRIDDQNFQSEDPIISVHDILNFAKKGPFKNFIVFQFLKNGQLDEIRHDEKVDLRDSGRETFIIFESDRCYRFKIGDRIYSWGSHLISGRWLYRLADIDSKTTTLFLISVGGKDQEVKVKDIIDLSDKEVECFQPRVKFSICIEGKTYPWLTDTITTEEIAELGGWDINQGVIAIDKDQNERTLEPGETVSLKGGLSFCKKQRFKRGLNEESRIAQELSLLEQYYDEVTYKNVGGIHWFHVKGLALPAPLTPSVIDVVFCVTAGHPISKPYGFYMPEGIAKNGGKLNFQKPPNAPPFEGVWCFKSWDAPHWNPKTDVLRGDNLWGWVRSFRQAISEGP